MVTHCTYCHKPAHGSLNRHTSNCPLQGVNFHSPKRSSQSQPFPHHSSHKQKVTVSEAETRFLSDTYAASPFTPSLQLHNVRSIKETVTAARLSYLQERVHIYDSVGRSHLAAVFCAQYIYKFKMKQDDETWLAVKTRRKWGRQSGDSIQSDGNALNST